MNLPVIAPTAERALTAHLWSYVRRATRPQCKISEWDLVLAHTGSRRDNPISPKFDCHVPKNNQEGVLYTNLEAHFPSLRFAHFPSWSHGPAFGIPRAGVGGFAAHPSCGAPAFGRERRKQIFCLAPFILYICLIIPAARVNQSQPRTV